MQTIKKPMGLLVAKWDSSRTRITVHLASHNTGSDFS